MVVVEKSGDLERILEQRANKILVIDNGTQYGDLYVKRFRDMGIETDSFSAGVFEDKEGRIVRPRISLEDTIGYAGVVIAGGRSSVTDSPETRVNIDPRIYTELNAPVLGTCFGHQDMADRMGGKVHPGLKQCGPVYTKVDLTNPFYKGLVSERQRVNSTHNDGVLELPPGFRLIASSKHELFEWEHADAMYKDADSGMNNVRIGTQYHPETLLTENGDVMLTNFINMCGLEKRDVTVEVKDKPLIEEILKEKYHEISDTIGDLNVFLPLSGGVDSTTATAMLLKAGIGRDKIKAFHIDTGFNRYGESQEVMKEYKKLGWDFVELIEAQDFFANYSLSEDELQKHRPDLTGRGFGGISLRDAYFSEHKRYLFQRAYADIIEQVMKKFGVNEFNSVLVQGTTQADRVESGKGGSKGRASASIKSHHNVGGFQQRFIDTGHLCEPMDRFFKPDIYRAAEILDLPPYFGERRPFPGPGILVRTANHNMIETGMYTPKQMAEINFVANTYASRYGMNIHLTYLEAVGSSGDERAEGVIAVLQFKDNHQHRVRDEIHDLLYVAGQLPHYTTFSRNQCITKIVTPLNGFDPLMEPQFTEIKNDSDYMVYPQLFDRDINELVNDIGLVNPRGQRMTQVVNYVFSHNFGHPGKYTMVFRPWDAPDLMTGIPLIPKDPGIVKQVFDRLREIHLAHDFIGDVAVDITYKPIGGTEVN